MTPELRFVRFCRYALFAVAVVSFALTFMLSIALALRKMRQAMSAI